jgi:Na+/H+ antiporter NhaB
MSQADAPSLAHAFAARFLGSVPGWYKAAILGWFVLIAVELWL